MNSLKKIAGDRRVEIADDERAAGNGIIITLCRGWSFDPLQDNRVAGADSLRQTVSLLAQARPFAGPYTA